MSVRPIFPDHIAVGPPQPAPLVMLPGTLCDERVFAPVLERLGRTATVPRLAGADSVEAMAAGLLTQLPETFSLAGFSLGAILAFELLRQAPGRIERLALLAANAGALDASKADSRRAIGQAEFVTATWADAIGPAHRADPALRRLLDDMAGATAPSAYAGQTAMTLARPDSHPSLAAIAVPTLVLCGSADLICPPRLGRDIAAAVPDARLVIVPGAGHYLTLEAPDAVAGALALWLARPSFHPFHVKEPT